jgi:hypothetical protein
MSAGPKQTRTKKGGKPPVQARPSAGSKQTRKEDKPAIRRERARAKRPRKIHALRMDDPDWPWPLPLCCMRAPVWLQQKVYRETRLFKRSQGITGPTEEERARYRAWRVDHGY